MIPEELCRKFWTACGYPSKDKIHYDNETVITVWTDKSLGTMVENLCGEEHHCNFESEGCAAIHCFNSDYEDNGVGEFYIHF